MIAGGGTGGHVVPGLAVAAELKARGHEVVFFGTKAGIEAKLVPAAGYRIEWIEAGGVNRVDWRTLAQSAWRAPRGVARAWGRLGRIQPAAMFSLGGYVAAPVMAAAALRGVPLVILEPNAMPGLANRIAGRRARRVLLGMAEAAAWFPEGRSEVSGVPVREAFFSIRPKRPGEVFRVLILGGSQGSRTLNRAFRESWPLFRAQRGRYRIVHQCGSAEAAELARDFEGSGVDGQVVPFIGDVPGAFAEADLVVSRAGASAVAELAAAGKPSVLAPYPFSADDHQRKNAEAFVRAGAAVLAPDAELSGERLFREIERAAGDPQGLERMGAAARRLARPGAARRAAEVLEEIAGEGCGTVDTALRSRNN